MSDLIYMLLLLVLGISAAVLFVVLKLKADGPRLYDVLAFSDGQLTILAGIPVSYPLPDIEMVTFSTIRGIQGNYTGVLRVVKRNGHKSRPFLFDGSAYAKHFVFYTTKKGIMRAIEALMEELRRHGVRCVMA